MEKDINNVGQLRIYEYIDDEGNVFWSFSETKERVKVRNLTLVDRVGLQFRRWDYELRRMVQIADNKKVLSEIEELTIVEPINWGKIKKDQEK